MSYYYYPLCSKDFTFENIFSSESISPSRVYELRGFGADFFYTIPLYHHPEMLVLYNNVPQYSITEPNYEALKFVLKIKEDAIVTDKLVFISEGIVGYTGTIYLNRQNFELLFFSEKELTVTCLRSETSLITKSYKKYANNFKIIKNSDCVPFDTSSIVQIVNDKDDLQQTIVYDRNFNSFKGFCYGLAAGLNRSFNSNDIVLKRSLQEITNNFAEFKNRIGIETSRTFNKGYRKNEIKGNLESNSKLFNSINRTEQLFRNYIPGESYSEKAFEGYVYALLKKQNFEIEEIKQFIKFKKMEDLLLGTNTLSKIKSAYLKTDSKNPALLFEVLRECVSNYSRSANLNSDWAKLSLEKSNDSFKQTIFELSKLVNIQSAKSVGDSQVNLSELHYDSKSNEVRIDPTFQNLNSNIQSEFVVILNTILHNTKSSKGDAKIDDVLSLVDLVATRLNGQTNGKKTHLYQYLNGEITDYDPDKISSIVMRNFVAFAFNPDSLEKLENYLNAKRIDMNWMAYSFWCCYNGFTNISRNFVAPFFDGTSLENTIYLDQFIPECFLNGKSTSIQKELKSPNELSQAGEKTIPLDKDEIISLFFEKYIGGKFKLSLAQFRELIKLNDRDAMIDSLKKNYRISKREAGKIIDQFEDQSRSPSLF